MRVGLVTLSFTMLHNVYFTHVQWSSMDLWQLFFSRWGTLRSFLHVPLFLLKGPMVQRSPPLLYARVEETLDEILRISCNLYELFTALQLRYKIYLYDDSSTREPYVLRLSLGL